MCILSMMISSFGMKSNDSFNKSEIPTVSCIKDCRAWFINISRRAILFLKTTERVIKQQIWLWISYLSGVSAFQQIGNDGSDRSRTSPDVVISSSCTNGYHMIRNKKIGVFHMKHYTFQWMRIICTYRSDQLRVCSFVEVSIRTTTVEHHLSGFATPRS